MLHQTSDTQSRGDKGVSSHEAAAAMHHRLFCSQTLLLSQEAEPQETLLTAQETHSGSMRSVCALTNSGYSDLIFWEMYLRLSRRAGKI